MHRALRFPVSQTNSMYQVASFGRGSTKIQDLERLVVDWEREIIFHCNSILHLEILRNHSCNSPFLAILVSVKRASVSYHDFLWIFVQRTLRLAIPDFSSIPPSREHF